MKIILTLTQLEADMLYHVAGNGWGDGDFAGWLGNKTQSKACAKAMEKLDKARRGTRKKQP